MNLTMLRGTIQAFEIQQSTLSTLRSIGESSAAAVSAAAAAAQSGFPPGPPDEAGVGESEDAKAADTGGKSRGKQSESARAAAAAGDEAGTAPPEAVPFPAFGTGMDPVAWWDLLQKQFGQVANAAMASIPMPGQAGGQPTRAAQPAAEAQPAAQPGVRSGDTSTAGAAQAAGSKASDAGAGNSGKPKARATGSAGTGTGASGARRRSTRSG